MTTGLMQFLGAAVALTKQPDRPMASKYPYFKQAFQTSMSAVREWKLLDGAQGFARMDLG